LSQPTEQVPEVLFEEEFKAAFQQYGAFSNLRAIPNVLDGCKPGHRRILYGMFKLGALPSKKMFKAAKAVGAVMGDYHPHGDSAIYATIVGMAQPFNYMAPLIEGQGNWGALSDPKSYGAYRYTECRLTDQAMALLGHAPGVIDGDIELDENAVVMMPNYSGEIEEPTVLPAMFPNYVVNGYEGIGTGIRGWAPSHNMVEALNLAIYMVDQPNPRLETVLKHVPAPDIPTNSLIFDTDDGGIQSYISTGHGGFVNRAKMHVEEYKIARNKVGHRIVVTGLPYQQSPTDTTAGLRYMVAEALLQQDIVVDNESKADVNIIIDIKENDVDDVMQRILHASKTTGLQKKFSVAMYAVVDDSIKSVGVIDGINHWITHRRSVVRRRSRYRLDKAERRLEVVTGFIKAVPIANLIVDLVRASADRREAADQMIATWGFTEIQAQSVLDMTISRLTKLGVDKFEEERQVLEATIAENRELLEDADALNKRLKKEMRAIRDAYGQPRQSTYVEGESATVSAPTEPAVPEPVVNGYVLLTGKGWLRWALQASRVKGVVGNDHVVQSIKLTDGNRVEAISSMGYHYRSLAGDLPDKMTNSAGLFDLSPGEELVYVGSSVTRGGEGSDIIVIAQDGEGDAVIKRIDWDDWAGHRANRTGRSIINLEDGWKVTQAFIMGPGDQEFAMLSKDGRILRVDKDTLVPKGRAARGNPAMNLTSAEDAIIWAGPFSDDTLISYWTGHGIGWFTGNKINQGNRNTKGQTFTRSGNYLHGAMVVAEHFDASEQDSFNLMMFGTGDDEPGSLTLSVGDMKPLLTLNDAQMIATPKPLAKFNAVWFE